MAFGAVLGVCVQPVGCFAVIIALLQPSPEHIAADRFMPLLDTVEAEDEAALAFNAFWLWMGHFDGMPTFRGRTPLHQIVALNIGIPHFVLFVLQTSTNEFSTSLL